MSRTSLRGARHQADYHARNPALSPHKARSISVPDDPTAVPTDLHCLAIADAARLIERGRLSPVELTDALLARIDALDPQLNAVLLPMPEKAAEREITAASYRGPLHGISFGLKDI